MKNKKIILVLLLLSAFSLSAQEYLFGSKKINPLETRYYVFGLESENKVSVEIYQESKGQIQYCVHSKTGLECNDAGLYQPKMESVMRSESAYTLESDQSQIVKSSTGWAYLPAEQKNAKAVSEVPLQSMKATSPMIHSLRNKSLLAYAYYSAQELLGMDRELNDEEMARTKVILRDSETNENTKSMDHSEFKKYLIEKMKQE